MGHSEFGNRLRSLRLARQWTQDDVAAGLRQLSIELDEPEPGIDANHVSKWESGVRSPGRRNRARLCVAFDVEPEQLGIPRTPRLMCDIGDLQQRRLSRPSAGDASLTLPAFPGIDGERLSTTLRNLWPVDRPLLDGMSRQAKELSRRSDIEAPAALIPDLSHFRQAVMALLSRSQPDEATAQLQTIASEMSRTIAWLSDPSTSWPDVYANYALAEAMARESGSSNQLAKVLINWSETEARRAALPEGLRNAVSLAERAALSIGADALAGLQGWVLGVRAVHAAGQGDEATADRRLDEAYRIAAMRPDEMNLFSDEESAWLDGYRASTVLRLRPVEAVGLFEDVIRNTSPALTWERVSGLNNLAAAHIAAGDVEEACAVLQKAVEMARRAGDERGLALALRARQGKLARWRSEPAVRRLDEAIRAARSA